MASAIRDFCGAQGDFGLDLSFVDDGQPRGTAGALLAALPELPAGADELLILYGDTLFNVDLGRMFAFHAAHAGSGSLFLHPNAHPDDSDLVELDNSGQVKALHPYPHAGEYANLVNAALYILNRKDLAEWQGIISGEPRIIDLAKDLFPQMLRAGCALYGYRSPEYIHDIGTPERLQSANADILAGRFALGSLATPRPAVFLDRDGVINREVEFLARRDDFELLPGAGSAIGRLNRAGLACIVVTNQPVIARGECTEAGLAAIHAHMDTLLGNEGAYVDRLYYCPHHPQKGFAGERPELKIKCSCRKPEIGMLVQARADLNIDFSRSWLVGDRTGDILAARRAGVKSILVRTGAAGRDGRYQCSPDYTVADLPEAVELILQLG